MNSDACKQGLLNPTRWFSTICTIATAVNLHEEMSMMRLMWAITVSALSSGSRYFLMHSTLVSKLTSN
jgi:hypothetical protein